ncbi:hypothetical protein TWF594_002342 [Orbilia oligospora]|nr:hypothetical protein TWF594_002342 [Orbilia oligospora]
MHDMHVFNFIDFALDFIPDPGLRRTQTEAINEKDGWKEYMDELGISARLKQPFFYQSLPRFGVLAQQFEESVKFFQYSEHRKDGKSEGTTERPSTNVSPVPEGSRTKLYRASTLERATRFYNHRTGEINEYHFVTLRGDLSGTDPVAYWTPQKAVIITEVEFSEGLAASVDLVSLWGTIEDGDKMNPPFQEYTWSCRKGIDYREPQYLKYLEDVDVITSNILSHKDIEYRERDSWKEIQPSDLIRIKIDGEDRLGIQWAFKSEEAQLAFEEHCRGKVTQYNLDRLLTVASKTERSLSSATG